MNRFGYLVEIRRREEQRTDLFDVWPKNSCKHCHGTGRNGQTLMGHKKHGQDEQAVLNLCVCLEKAEKRIRQCHN